MRRNLNKNSISESRIIQECSGFTLIELMVATVILAIIVAIAFSFYGKYINKARITVAVSVLSDTRKNLYIYNMENGGYPASINFPGCTDDNGHTVFPPALCEQLKNELFSAPIYTPIDKSYTLTARAKDSTHTLLTLTESNITIEGQ
ncbi:MAG: prepilin-type N-terminal cleavage/methylation domain-containing protein [Deltaproteobacteria bacterium]|nr:prepilin-type N-terminal cleavage/methylation domain-containing protein [Deltaproteobacteria bacterium]